MAEYMKAEIGRIDEPLKVVCFKSEDTLKDILRRVNITLSIKEDVYDMYGNIVNLKESVKESTYFILNAPKQNILTIIKKIITKYI